MRRLLWLLLILTACHPPPSTAHLPTPMVSDGLVTFRASTNAFLIAVPRSWTVAEAITDTSTRATWSIPGGSRFTVTVFTFQRPFTAEALWDLATADLHDPTPQALTFAEAIPLADGITRVDWQGCWQHAMMTGTIWMTQTTTRGIVMQVAIPQTSAGAAIYATIARMFSTFAVQPPPVDTGIRHVIAGDLIRVEVPAVRLAITVPRSWVQVAGTADAQPVTFWLANDETALIALARWPTDGMGNDQSRAEAMLTSSFHEMVDFALSKPVRAHDDSLAWTWSYTAYPGNGVTASMHGTTWLTRDSAHMTWLTILIPQVQAYDLRPLVEQIAASVTPTVETTVKVSPSSCYRIAHQRPTHLCYA